MRNIKPVLSYEDKIDLFDGCQDSDQDKEIVDLRDVAFLLAD